MIDFSVLRSLNTNFFHWKIVVSFQNSRFYSFFNYGKFPNFFHQFSLFIQPKNDNFDVLKNRSTNKHFNLKMVYKTCEITSANMITIYQIHCLSVKNPFILILLITKKSILPFSKPLEMHRNSTKKHSFSRIRRIRFTLFLIVPRHWFCVIHFQW